MTKMHRPYHSQAQTLLSWIITSPTLLSPLGGLIIFFLCPPESFTSMGSRCVFSFLNLFCMFIRFYSLSWNHGIPAGTNFWCALTKIYDLPSCLVHKSPSKQCQGFLKQLYLIAFGFIEGVQAWLVPNLNCLGRSRLHPQGFL